MKLFLVVLFILFNNLFAQRTLDRAVYLNSGDNFYYSYFVSPSNSNDSLDYTILFKVSHSVLTFNKSEENRMQRTFTATPTVEIVFYDSDGIIRNRDIITDTINVNDFEETNSKLQFSGNYLKTRLKKSDYKVKISLLDRYNQRIKKYQFNITADFSNSKRYSNPFFTKESDNNSSPLILNGNLDFSSDESSVYFLTNNTNSSIPVLLEKIKNQDEEKELWDKKINYNGQAEIINQIPYIKMIDRMPEISFSEINSQEYRFAKIRIPSYEFVPGKYKIVIGNIPDTSVFYFEVAWFNKPASLNDIDYALESMEYLLTKNQLKEIDSGDNTEIFKNIIDYWKQRDPTPATPYNEAMAEYFRRVDYAALNYSTIKEKNGMKTDRGKIYILFGEPSNVNSQLKDDSSYEIWDYTNRVNRTFTFEMVSSGIFKLIDVKDKNNKSK